MQKGIDSYIKEQFGISEVDIRTYSPLTLAYIGDGIFDLVIRSVVVGKGNTRAGELHKRTSQIVKAHTQAEMIEKSPTMAKNATMSDYRKATGFEALMGYLYLKDEFERLVELVKTGVDELALKM